MDREYLQLFMQKTEFPLEAQESILTDFNVVNKKCQEEFKLIFNKFKELDFVTRELVEPVIELSKKTKVNEYALWLLLVVAASKEAMQEFIKKGANEQIFWDTFTDLRYKLLECKNTKGVWGTFVAHWYRKLLRANVIKLGRLEFETRTFVFEEPYIFGDITLEGEVDVKSVHIPSAPEKFDFDARLDSYKKAYKFFMGSEKGKPMVFICHSWLLFTPYKEILSPKSNIVDFMGDFDIIKIEETQRFGDAWRIFGADAEKEPQNLPEKTSLQRAFKEYLVQGNNVGQGIGVIIFDGEKILNK